MEVTNDLLGGFVIVSTECESCGAETAVRLVDHKPTDQEIADNELFLGGMLCIRTHVLKLTINGESKKTEAV